MRTAGRGTSGTSNWSSGFIPSTYQGALFRNKWESVVNLDNSAGITDAVQGKSIEGLNDLNRQCRATPHLRHLQRPLRMDLL